MPKHTTLAPLRKDKICRLPLLDDAGPKGLDVNAFYCQHSVNYDNMILNLTLDLNSVGEITISRFAHCLRHYLTLCEINKVGKKIEKQKDR